MRLLDRDKDGDVDRDDAKAIGRTIADEAAIAVRAVNAEAKATRAALGGMSPAEIRATWVICGVGVCLVAVVLVSLWRMLT